MSHQPPRQLPDLAGLGDHDAKQVRDFARFLEAVGPVDAEDKRPAPAEWHPYIKGQGPAPQEVATCTDCSLPFDASVLRSRMVPVDCGLGCGEHEVVDCPCCGEPVDLHRAASS